MSNNDTLSTSTTMFKSDSLTMTMSSNIAFSTTMSSNIAFSTTMSNNDTGDSFSDPEIEKATWTEGLVAGLMALVFGLAGALVNALCPFIVHKNKHLHTPCFVNIAAHAVFCSIISVGYFTNGLELTGSALGLLSLKHSRIQCYLMYLTLLTTIPASGVITCFLGVDRFMAILYPLRYRTMGNGLNTLCILLATLAGLGCAVAAGMSLPDPVENEIMCFHFLAAYHPAYTAFHTNFVLVCYVASVGLYFSILLAVEHKKLKHAFASSGHSQDMKRFFKRQLSTLPMIKFLAAIYGTLGILPPLLSFLFSVLENGRYAQRAWYYAHMLKVLLATVDFVALTLKCAEFRTTLKIFLCGKPNNQVAPLSIT